MLYVCLLPLITSLVPTDFKLVRVVSVSVRSGQVWRCVPGRRWCVALLLRRLITTRRRGREWYAGGITGDGSPRECCFPGTVKSRACKCYKHNVIQYLICERVHTYTKLIYIYIYIYIGSPNRQALFFPFFLLERITLFYQFPASSFLTVFYQLFV